jgi:hypothetical protein
MPQTWDEHGNPISAAPQSGQSWDEQGNPIETQKPASKPTPETAVAQSKAGLIPSTIGPRPKGISSWLQSLESDVRSGSGTTVPGKVLQKMGAPGIESGGTSKEAAEFMGSPLTGTIRAAQGLSMMPSHPWEGAKRTVGGAMEAATIPGMIAAGPSEEGAATLGKIETLMKDARAAKKAGKTLDEWRNINKALAVSPRAVRIGEGAKSLEQASTMPGRTLERAGFTAKQLGKMKPLEQLSAIKPHLDKAGQAIETVLANHEKAGKTLDVGAKAFETLKKIPNPNVQQAALDAFNDLAKEIGIVNQRAATPTEAWKLRRALVAGARFGQGGDLNSLSNVRGALYGAVSSDLKAAVPELEQLDRQFSDLKGAVTAARNAAAKEAVAGKKPGLLGAIAKGAKEEITKRPIRTAAYALGIPAVGYEVGKHYSSAVPGR